MHICAMDLYIKVMMMLQFMKLLGDLNGKNFNCLHRSTTSIAFRFKMLLRRIVKKVQHCGGRTRVPEASSPESRKSRTNYLRSKTSYDERFAVFITRHKMKISDNSLSALLVVSGLLVAATFPAIFSPPGSVRQGDNGTNNTLTNTNSSLSGSLFPPPPMAGTVVMDSGVFLYFSIYNSGVLHASICFVGLLLPDGFFGAILMILLLFMLSCYNISIQIISPGDLGIRLVDSLFLTAMYLAVVFVLAIHEGGKRKLRRFFYSSDKS